MGPSGQWIHVHALCKAPKVKHDTCYLQGEFRFVDTKNDNSPHMRENLNSKSPPKVWASCSEFHVVTRLQISPLLYTYNKAELCLSLPLPLAMWDSRFCSICSSLPSQTVCLPLYHIMAGDRRVPLRGRVCSCQNWRKLVTQIIWNKSLRSYINDLLELASLAQLQRSYVHREYLGVCH